MDIVRSLAIKVLHEVEEKDGYSNIVLEKFLKENREKLTKQDIGFLTELVYGVITWKLTLDKIIQKYSNIKLKKIASWTIQILRIGAYQILFLDKVPVSAAVNESVNLAKKYAPKSTGFVNAILRKVKKEDKEELEKIDNEVEKIMYTTSNPGWMVKELLKEYPLETVEKICKNSNNRGEVSIRVNQLKITKKELQEILQKEGIESVEANLSDFLFIKKGKDLIHLSSYKEGLFTIQDQSAGLSSILLEPKEGDNILDACSAPGGKTTYLAELMNNKGKIEAWDLYENRLKLVEENAKRLGISIIQTKVNDATDGKEEKEKYDKILLDVPCMGLGVIRKKPDIKWQKKKEDIGDICKMQYRILQNVSKKLKTGGRLIYSTCSILKQENEEIIKQFLTENPEFTLMEMKNDFKIEIEKKDIGITILPCEKNDGFYICAITKR